MASEADRLRSSPLGKQAALDAMARDAEEEEDEDEDDGDEEQDGDSEIEELEQEVRQMADKVLNYRRTVPDRLGQALAASLAAQRPRLSISDTSDIGRAGGEGGSGVEGNATSSGNVSLLQHGERMSSIDGVDQEVLEKLQKFKLLISNNAEALPNLLKRVRECISRVDQISDSTLNIPSCFKKQQTL